VADSKCHKGHRCCYAMSVALSLFTPRRLAVAIDKRSAWTAIREGATVDTAGTMGAGVGCVNPG
jgi:hypothetical protein